MARTECGSFQRGSSRGAKSGFLCLREWDLLFLRHSAENILGHAAARGEIGPDTFPLLGCADLLFCPPHRATALHRVWESLDTTTCARAPRKCASSWARTLASRFSRMASPAHKREVSQFRTCHSCDRIGCHHQAQLSQANKKQAGRQEGIFFPANLSNSHQSLIGLRGRHSHVFVVASSDRANGARHV